MKVSAWLLRLAAWLPLCFAAWYYMAPAADRVVAQGSRMIVNAAAGDIVVATETGAGGITFVTRLKVGAGVITIDAEPRVYSYGLPLGAAVLLAALPAGLAWKLAALLATGLPIVVWGVAFDVLAHLLRSAPAWSAGVFSSAGKTAIAIAFQFGSLIFPALVPTALAVAFCREKLTRA